MAISERPDISDEGAPSAWVGQRMTLEEFLALPEQKPALEYDEGVVTQKMAAKPVHGAIQSFLIEVINQFARPRRLGICLAETRFVGAQWAPVPDVVFYRRERLHVRRAPADFTTPPDLAVEIVSPGQALTDQIQKCLDYLARGTAVALIVHPAEESVFVLRQGQILTLLRADARIDLEDVLPGFNLTVHELYESVNWSWLDEEPAVEAAPDATGSTQADEATAPERSDG